MRQASTVAVGVLALLLSTPAAGLAQQDGPPIHVNVGGGATLIQGDFGTWVDLAVAARTGTRR